VKAPVGAVVSSLPDGTNTVVKSGETYFQYGEPYHKAESSGGGVVHDVVAALGVAVSQGLVVRRSDS